MNAVSKIKTENEKITVEDIEKMSYPDFVGFINQWNVLPGAHVTLSKWRVFSQIDSKSRILEVACTTGFSSRELALMTGCSGQAFDISQTSIDAANHNKNVYAPQIKIGYTREDGYKFQTSERFTHILVGGALKFFPRPQEMLDKCVNLLIDGGYLLASPFYIQTPIPESLVTEFQSVFGMKPTTEPYKDIMKLYKGFEIIYEEHNELVQETSEELSHYCKSTVDRASKDLGVKDNSVLDSMYRRLYRVKDMSNKLRPYQRYVILVLRYNSKVYPNRFVELF